MPAEARHRLNITQHEPEDACKDWHCYSCHVDEQGRCYEVCPECFHRYRTRLHLVAAYWRSYWQISRQKWWDQSVRSRVWQILTVRPKHITFCQHCMHDF